MADIKWIKLAVDVFDNRKVRRILAYENGERVLLFWLRLLCLAGKCNEGGALMFTEDVPFDAEGLAIECAIPVAEARENLARLSSLGMLYERDGVLTVYNWERHQSAEKMELIREQTRERMRKSRARKASNGADVTQKSVTCYADVTQCYATEKEEEKEPEQEIQSVTLARESADFSTLPVENSIESSFTDTLSRTKDLLDESGDPDPRDTVEQQQQWCGRRMLRGRLGRGKVLLSDAQIDALLGRLTLEEFHHYVSRIADCEEQGKHFKRKTHYEAILEMAAKDRRT